MIANLMQWFRREAEQLPESKTPELAAAVLMVEVLMADHDPSAAEMAMLSQRFEHSLGLPAASVQALIDEALAEHEHSVDLYSYTRVINEALEPTEKYRLLVDLWLLAFASGDIDTQEEAMIRKITDLIYLGHSDFIQAKQEARQAT